MNAKPLRIRFDKVDGFIKIYDETRYLVLFGPERYDTIYNKIRYLISKERGIIVLIVIIIIDHNFGRIRIDSYNSLPKGKTLTFHNVIILIKSVFNKNKSHYQYNIFLEKGSYQNKSYIQCFKMNVYIL